MTRSLLPCLLLFIILTGCHRLNHIQSDGYRDYEGGPQRGIYFETKSDVRPFLKEMCNKFGMYNASDTSAMGKTFIWNKLNDQSISNETFNLQLTISEEFKAKELTEVYDVTTVFLIFMGSENLIESSRANIIEDEIQEIINTSLE